MKRGKEGKKKGRKKEERMKDMERKEKDRPVNGCRFSVLVAPINLPSGLTLIKI
jgi:hypothetical protein